MPAAPCPNCGRPVDVVTDPQRPFCSARCRLIDLGGWLTDGARSIPAEPPSGADVAAVPDPDER